MEALSDDEVSVSSLVSQEDDDKNEPKNTEVDDLVSDSEQLEDDDDDDDDDGASVQSDDVPNSSIEQPDVESAPLNYSSDYGEDSDDYNSVEHLIRRNPKFRFMFRKFRVRTNSEILVSPEEMLGHIK